MSLETVPAVRTRTSASVLTQPNPRRSLAIAALGAVVGLALAGYSLFTAAGTDTKTVPDDSVAVVNGRSILRRDFDTQAETEYGKPPAQLTPTERRAVLDAMIREELLVQRGLEIEVPKTDPDVRQAIVNAVNLAGATELEARPVSDAELKDYYDHHREDYVVFGTLRLSEFVLPAGPDAASAAREATTALRHVGSSADLALVLAQLGLRDTGRLTAEEVVEPVAERTLGEELYAVVAKLAPGEVSPPIRQPDGFHLVLLREHHAKSYFPFEQVREKVRKNFRSAAQSRAEQELVDHLRAKARILIAP